MILVETKRGSEIFLVPQDEEHIGMFKHCTGGHVSITKKAYKQEYRNVFHAHNIFCKVIPINPKYFIPIESVMKAIDVAEVNYKSNLAFGTLSAVILRNEIAKLPHDDGMISVPRIMKLLVDVESPKTVGGANSGLNFVRNQIKLGRIDLNE